MTALRRAASILDLRRMARRRLPRFAFDFIDGGAESETNLRLNQSAFGEIRMVPRYLVDVSKVSTETSLFGVTHAYPLGVAPVGFLNVAGPGSDLHVARLAARKKIPYAISTASSTPLEALAEAAEGRAWFQIYVSRDEAITANLLDRAEKAGCETLAVTVDVSQPGKRDRDIRNGLQVPIKPDWRMLAQLALHPRWSLATLAKGSPNFANFTGGAAGNLGAIPLSETQKRVISSAFDWEDLKRIRDRWKGNLLIKGLMHHADAELAIEAGCDGIVVSNHGGRQVDYAPASIQVLPAIARAVAGRVPVLFDGGIRRGADIVRAKALGADFVFAGRAFAYGVAAGGGAGVERAFEILETELTSTIGQLGLTAFDAVDAGVLETPTQ